MAIDPSAIGAVTEPTIYEWSDRDTLLYALGVGAGDDLQFLQLRHRQRQLA